MQTLHEIILCIACKGKGLRYWDELTNYHKREYDTHSAFCSSCDGSGLVTKITKIEYKPYKVPTPSEPHKEAT